MTMTDAEFVREIAQPLSGGVNDYDGLLKLIGNARFVLVGEATHGTHEFYFERAAITKRLIAEKGFSIVAIEADWPDSARVHRYVRGVNLDAIRIKRFRAFAGFQRGCGVTKSCWSSWNGCVALTNSSIPNARRSDSMEWIFTACTRRSKRCSAILRNSIPRLRDVRDCATPVSIILAITRKSTGMPPLSALSNHVR